MKSWSKDNPNDIIIWQLVEDAGSYTHLSAFCDLVVKLLENVWSHHNLMTFGPQARCDISAHVQVYRPQSYDRGLLLVLSWWHCRSYKSWRRKLEHLSRNLRISIPFFNIFFRLHRKCIKERNRTELFQNAPPRENTQAKLIGSRLESLAAAVHLIKDEKV